MKDFLWHGGEGNQCGLRRTQQREGRDGKWGKKEVEEHGLRAEREVD